MKCKSLWLRAGLQGLAFLLLLSFLAGCGTAPASLVGAFPGDSDLPDWTPVGETETYDQENLFDLVDGQAEAYFAYGFEQVATRRYENGEGVELDLQIWQVARPADAYGLFTASRGGTPVPVGDGGDADPGRRIVFWQDRYYVQVFARRPVADAQLQQVAQTIAAALPEPPSGQVPDLVARLPADGLLRDSLLFFHEEISIQDIVWLGGENLLGLGPQTDGVLAQYEREDGQGWLLLIQYPEAADAAAGLAALEATDVVTPADLGLGGDLLAAAFGQLDGAAAKDLVSQALGKE
ncbi:MAG: DUF6599 family protein [Anaerolineae bacterium]